MATKTCSKCEEDKLLDEFGLDKKTKDKHRAQCRNCFSLIQLKYRCTYQGCMNLLYNGAKNNSKHKHRKHKEFTLVKQDLYDLYQTQNGLCYYSKLPMTFRGAWKMSLERLDQTKGYIRENVVLCCLEFNTPTPWSHEHIQTMFNRIIHGNIDRQPYETFQIPTKTPKPLELTESKLVNGAQHYRCNTCRIFKAINDLPKGFNCYLIHSCFPIYFCIGVN